MDHNVTDHPLKLRRDAVYLKTEDGIFFRSTFGDFSLKGKTIYNSFTALLPHLDGGQSERALCESLSEDSRTAAAALLKVLVDRKIVYRIDPGDRALVAPGVAAHFAPQIDYLNHFADDPGRRLLAFRNARVLLLGSGEAMVAAAAALLLNGLAKLAVATSHRATLDSPLWPQMQAEAAEQGATPVVTWHEIGAVTAAAFDLVIYCSATPDLALLRTLALDRQVKLLPSFLLGERSYVGPSATPDDAGCWLCAMLRRSARVSPDSARDFWREMTIGSPAARAAPLTSLTAQMLGNSVALEAYKLLVGITAPQTRAQLLEQNLATLETAVCRFLPDPACPRCAGIEPYPAEPPPRDVEAAVARLTPYQGHDFASWAAFDGDRIEQLPISVTMLPTREGPIYGWSVKDALHARAHALGEAIRRDVVTGDARFLLQAAASGPTVAVERIAGWLGCGDAEFAGTAVSGTRLDDYSTVSIPAAAVHPGLDEEGRFDSGGAGLGVGIAHGEATERAVFDLYEHLAIERLADGALQLWRWSGIGTEADASTAYLVSVIRHLAAEPPEIAIGEYDGLALALVVPDEEKVPTAGELELCCGFTAADAVRSLLERCVARLQVIRNGLIWCEARRCGTFMKLPVALPALVPAPPALDRPHADIAALAARLARDKAALLVSDVTPPDIRATGSYTIVKALRLRALEEA